jgi:gamma-glutamylaminecyclotransferase
MQHIKEILDKNWPSKTMVAVYGSLKKGFHNHRLLEKSRHVGNGVVWDWQMFSVGSYPMIAKGLGKVYVEIYEVDGATFSNLDRLEGYPSYYNRKLVDVDDVACDGKLMDGSGESVRAWIYFGTDQQVSELPPVPRGIWTKNAINRASFV